MEGYIFDPRIITDSDSDHILKTRFGSHVDNDNNPLQDMINEARQIPYMAAQIVLRDRYEQMYGLFDHNSYGASKPLALIAKHPGEDVHTHSRLHNSIKRFIENGIGDELRCSMQEFFALPREYTKLCFDIVAERRNRKNHSAADIERRLADELNGRRKT